MRIDSVLSNLKYGSRKDVWKMIQAGRVMVNDHMVFKKDYKVSYQDQIKIDHEIIYFKDKTILMLHKPKNYVSATKDAIHHTVIELLDPIYQRLDLKVAGRLDRDVEGLLILTDSGELIHKITSPKSNIEKKYQAVLNQPFYHHQALLSGVECRDEFQNTYHAVALDIKSEENCVIITINQGKFHQVKRMFKAVGYDVIDLKRIQIGKLELGDLPIGSVKEIKETDIYD